MWPVSVCPGVDDRAPLAADDLVVPEPGLGVDRLAHRAEQAQLGEVVALGVLGPPLHARADRGRRGVEDRHAVALAQLPPDVLVRVVRRALEHHAGRAVGQRPVDDVGVAGHPADVGRAPVDVGVGLEVEDQPVCVGDAGQVAAARVQDALRLGRRAGGVEDVERVLGVKGLGRALGVRRLDRLVVPDVAPLGHRRVRVLRGAHDEDRLDRRQILHHLVDALLDRGALALAARAVGRHERLGLRDLHALLDRLGAEAAEHDVVDRADARARQHRHDDLGDHRQVYPDDVAGADAPGLERVGEALHLRVQVGVGDVALLALLAVPVERDAVAPAGLDVAVEAVVGDVELAADEPLGVRRIGPVEHLLPRLRPVERLGLLGPEALVVLLRLAVDRLAVGDVRLLDELGRRRERLALEQLLEVLLKGRAVGHVVSSSSACLPVLSGGYPLTVTAAPSRRPGQSPTGRRARGTSARRRAPWTGRCPGSSRGTPSGSRSAPGC